MDAVSADRARSKRHGGDHRGSSYARRARKLWMLAQVRFGGNGVTCGLAIWSAAMMSTGSTGPLVRSREERGEKVPMQRMRVRPDLDDMWAGEVGAVVEEANGIYWLLFENGWRDPFTADELVEVPEHLDRTGVERA